VYTRGLDADVFVTERPGHARELAASALRRGAAMCIAWGGDGTVNEVASALVHTGAALGIVPGGSGNGLARDLGIPADPAAAFATALSGTARAIDAGEVDGHLFFNVAGFGLDARVARAFGRGGRRGLARYVQITVRELLAYRPAEYVVTVDGQTERGRPLIVAVANSRQYGNGALIAPRARLDDGRLDVVVVEHRSPLRVLVQARRLFTGTLGDAPGVSMRAGSTIEVSSPEPVVYHVDGEPHAGGTVVPVQVRPAVLRVISPAT
jgi:YegS/Rv2252/BmrU family lipid kinase